MQPWRLPALLCLCCLLSACQAGFFRVVNAVNRVPGIVMTTEVFDSANGLSMDVFRSENTPPGAPVLVYVYGGSWRNGERGWYRFVGRALAAEGLIVAIPDYRKYPSVFPSFVEDAASAVRHARDNARRWGGDEKKLFLSGHSAGAHMAMLLATDARYLAKHDMKPRDLRGMIGISGVYDFAPIIDPELQEVFPDRVNEMLTQPIAFVDGDEPPMLLLHGGDDGTVWPRNSQRLDAKLREHGIESTLIMYPGVGHGGIMLAIRKRGDSKASTREDLVRFVRTH